MSGIFVLAPDHFEFLQTCLPLRFQGPGHYAVVWINSFVPTFRVSSFVLRLLDPKFPLFVQCG